MRAMGAITLSQKPVGRRHYCWPHRRLMGKFSLQACSWIYGGTTGLEGSGEEEG